MPRHLMIMAIAIGAMLLLPACDKSDSSSGAGSSAPAASGSGDQREHHEHQWDGGPHGDHPH